jgi:hypothetical protein
VAYDKDGKIIGGGNTFLTTVPAGGKTPVKITLFEDKSPAKIEIYAGLTDISEIGK